MPPKTKKEPKVKVSQKQKSTQAQAVKQTVRVVVGETKKPRRPYRRRPKVAQPPPPPVQPMISPIPQVIQLPPQQSPFAMFSPEQFSRSIADQINQRLAVQPILAEAMPIQAEGVIAMAEPERSGPSLAESMKQNDESYYRELERVRREQEKEMAAAIRTPPPRPPPGPPPGPPPTSEMFEDMPEDMPEEMPNVPAAKKRRERKKPSKAAFEQEYFELTGEYPPNMRYEVLATEITRLRRASGTKMPGTKMPA